MSDDVIETHEPEHERVLLNDLKKKTPAELLAMIVLSCVEDMIARHDVDDDKTRWAPAPRHLAELALVCRYWLEICAPLLHSVVFVRSALIDEFCDCMRKSSTGAKKV